LKGDAQIKRKEKLEAVRGSGNVFRDLGHNKNAITEQFKAILATEIIEALDGNGWRCALRMRRTAGDFSCIRNADLGRFTADRLIAVLNRLGSRVEVKVRLRPAKSTAWNTQPGPLVRLIQLTLVLPQEDRINRAVLQGYSAKKGRSELLRPGSWCSNYTFRRKMTFTDPLRGCSRGGW
jgi:hypothetical protein